MDIDKATMRLITSTFVLILGILPAVFAGNQCNIQFPGRGYCVGFNQFCPVGTQEYTRLSNGIGCPTMSSRCCVASNNNGGTVTANDRSQCGMGSLQAWTRVLNGINAAPCDWPFVVSIRSKRKNSTQLNYFGTKHLCAGVLIDRQWVLTSAVCILNAAGATPNEARNRAVVVAGEYNVSGIDIYPTTGGQQEQVINVDRTFLHPKYAYSHYSQIDLSKPKDINSNGIGLIRLSQPISGRCAGVICLPTLQEAQDDCASYTGCVITGWGFTSDSYSTAPNKLDTLKQNQVRLASKKGCNLVSNRLGLNNVRPAGTMCQQPDLFPTDSCFGDEGGAVMCSTGTNWVVRAILPFNILCENDHHNLYVTDVSLYLDWIRNTMNSWGRYRG